MAAGSTYTPIATTTVSGSSTTSVVFNSISGYTDLVVISNLTGSQIIDPGIQFNGDTGTNYSNTILSGNGSTVSSNVNTSVSYVRMDEGAYLTTSNPNIYITQIMNYSNSTTYKTVLGRNNNAATGVDAIVSLWRNTAAITSVNVYVRGAGYFVAGSTITVYGIAAA